MRRVSEIATYIITENSRSVY